MAGAIIEIKYFNTFLLKKTNSSNEPIWNGSFGIPPTIGGYPAVGGSLNDTNSWVIEESRIRGGFNNTNVDYGVKAYIVEEEPSASSRVNSLIYSGIFNSRTGINRTNVFSVGEDITKSTDPANGSIQKLYAEDTNLIILQENKVSRALIDKDAIYSAEGGGAVTSSNLVIGVIQPYAGEYGISKNPESFAVYGYRKYFSDKNNNVILRLSLDGIEEISSYGMTDFFRDQLNDIDSQFAAGKVIGGYDIHNNQYVVSMQGEAKYQTLSFDERPKGWTSRFSYNPDQIFSLRNKLYTAKTVGGLARTNGAVTGSANLNIDNVQNFIQANSIVTTSGSGIPANTTVVSFNSSSGALVLSNPVTLADNVILTFSGVARLWQHYSIEVNRGNFYGVDTPSSIALVLNPNPTNSKNFQTIGYEGSNGWKVNSILSDSTGEDNGTTWTNSFDSISPIYSYYEGEYVINPANNQAVTRANYAATFGTANPPYPRYHAGFTRKENKYVANIVNNSPAAEGEIIWGDSMSGIKGFYATATLSTDNTTNLGGEKSLFSVESTYVMNNGY